MPTISDARILIIATDGFEDSELLDPRQALIDRGASVTLASLDTKAVKKFMDAGKPVGAICHGPWLLAEADAVRGRTVTSWPSIRTDLRNAGAEVVDREAVTDGNLVTSRKPEDIPAFTEAFIQIVETADAPMETA